MSGVKSEVIVVNGMNNKIHYPEVPRSEDLKKFYDVFNEIFKDNPNCFYKHEDVVKMKKDKSKIFI